jgi:hypothetical protein
LGSSGSSVPSTASQAEKHLELKSLQKYKVAHKLITYSQGLLVDSAYKTAGGGWKDASAPDQAITLARETLTDVSRLYGEKREKTEEGKKETVEIGGL